MMDLNSFRGSSEPKDDAPALDLIETCWRLKAPSGKVLTCGIYKTAAGLEVRCQYSDRNLVRSELAAEITIARIVAEEWRQVAIAEGFTQLRAES